MNYYIQGDAANAEKIRTAFERQGYTTSGFNFKSDKGVYYTDRFSKSVDFVSAPTIVELIKTHPDYKELELPVEPKFKVGDWLWSNTLSVHPILVKDYSEQQGYKVEGLGLTYYIHQGVVDNKYHLWTIQDVKDGDVIAFNDSPDVNLPLRWVGIYKQPRVVSNKSYWFHCIITPDCTFKGYDSWWMTNAHPATKEQRDKLFKKMKEAGYQWDADKKELLKIKHYDINNFYAGMEVLVRDGDDEEWNYLHFSHYRKKLSDHFFAGGNPWFQCIPFEGNEHLLGTTDMPSEEYINW